jgi:hypothetical protein
LADDGRRASLLATDGLFARVPTDVADEPEASPWLVRPRQALSAGHRHRGSADQRIARRLRDGVALPAPSSPPADTSLPHQPICGYLRKNRRRKRYDEYLWAGYPIASGVIEGACRHLVKHRLERAGMHWTVEGAQAMLDLRSVWIAGKWEAFQQHHIERDRERLYPHRDLVAGEAFFALAP